MLFLYLFGPGGYTLLGLIQFYNGSERCRHFASLGVGFWHNILYAIDGGFRGLLPLKVFSAIRHQISIHIVFNKQHVIVIDRILLSFGLGFFFNFRQFGVLAFSPVPPLLLLNYVDYLVFFVFFALYCVLIVVLGDDMIHRLVSVRIWIGLAAVFQEDLPEAIHILSVWIVRGPVWWFMSTPLPHGFVLGHDIFILHSWHNQYVLLTIIADSRPIFPEINLIPFIQF